MHVVARDADEALIRLLEAGEEAQRRGLAAARRTQEGQELAGEHFDGDVVDRDRGAEPLGDVDDLHRPALCSSHPPLTGVFRLASWHPCR